MEMLLIVNRPGRHENVDPVIVGYDRGTVGGTEIVDDHACAPLRLVERPTLHRSRSVNHQRKIEWLRTGSPWRDLPLALGKWNSVFQRFRRWAKKGAIRVKV